MSSQFENPHERAAETPGKWILIVAAKPKARMVLYQTVPPAMNNGTTIRKYSTRFGSNFEAHEAPNGVVTWYKLIKVPLPGE